MLLSMIFCLVATGCGEGSNHVSSVGNTNHFEFKVDILSDDAELYIARINLFFSGRHPVKLIEADHGRSEINSAVSPNGETSILVVFSYTDVGESRIAKTLFSLRGVSEGDMSTTQVSAGGPSEFVVRDDEDPKGVFNSAIETGTSHPFGQPITIARVRGEPVKLVVE